MMTSRERVYATLDYELDGRVPRHLWTLPWAESNHPDMIRKLARKFPNDVVSPPSCYLETPRVQGDAYSVGNYVDEWGCVFENLQAGVIGEVKHPLVESLTQKIDIRGTSSLQIAIIELFAVFNDV